MKTLSIFAISLLSALSAFGQRDTARTSDAVSVIAKHAAPPADSVKVGPNFVEICVIRVTGEKTCQVNHNLKTTGGIDALFQATMNTQPAAFKYLYLSTNASAPLVGDCAAGSSACTLASVLTSNGLAPATGTFAHSNGTATATLAWTWTAATSGTSNVQEAAICNNITPGSGTCAFENTFTPVTLNVGDQLQLTWTITIS